MDKEKQKDTSRQKETRKTRERTDQRRRGRLVRWRRWKELGKLGIILVEINMGETKRRGVPKDITRIRRARYRRKRPGKKTNDHRWSGGRRVIGI